MCSFPLCFYSRWLGYSSSIFVLYFSPLEIRKDNQRAFSFFLFFSNSTQSPLLCLFYRSNRGYKIRSDFFFKLLAALKLPQVPVSLPELQQAEEAKTVDQQNNITGMLKQTNLQNNLYTTNIRPWDISLFILQKKLAKNLAVHPLSPTPAE